MEAEDIIATAQRAAGDVLSDCGGPGPDAVMGDTCIVWAGHYADNIHSHPTTQGEGGRLTVRALLCPGDPRLPVVMTCATLGCINPKHMRRVPSARPKDIGQVKQMTSAGRPSSLPADYAPKTRPEDHAEIRSLVRSGQAQREVAAKFGVSQSTISRIMRTA